MKTRKEKARTTYRLGNKPRGRGQDEVYEAKVMLYPSVQWNK